MNRQSSAYPIKITSRAAKTTRLKKLRVHYFALGIAFGLGCTTALNPAFSPNKLLAFFHSDTPAAADTVAESLVAAADVASAPAEVAAVASEDASTAQLSEADVARKLNLKVRNGDTFISLLTDAGVSTTEAHALVESIRKVYDPRKLNVGQNLAVELHKDTQNNEMVVASLTMPTSITSTLELTREENDSYTIKQVDAPVKSKVARTSGTITSSLYETATKMGMPASMLSELINAYSYDVDFQRDIKDGDTIEVLFERLETEDGAVVGVGKMIYAQLEIGGKPMKIYRYSDKKGNVDFFNEKGESIRKALLRTPINGAKITSGFGMRNHPIMGYSKMHRGVDFAAPTGTPIYAAGDGVIDFVGVKGGYGNYLRVKHNGAYSSAYAHISRFAKGIAQGTRVKQGQIIAYVGTTGMSTGPHLHYEILVNNSQVNPSGVKFKTGTVLAGNELKQFKANVEKVQATLENTEKLPARLAMNSSGKSRLN
ncbi:MAG: peptidoglycan DD-metalloendopeptidase family protein [Rickettsiales bacterium]|nr:peptidoglycan DD-metalloendopeptidase family protein [Rickettsiales bacterium]